MQFLRWNCIEQWAWPVSLGLRLTIQKYNGWWFSSTGRYIQEIFRNSYQMFLSQAFSWKVSPWIYLVLVGAHMLPGPLHDHHDYYYDHDFFHYHQECGYNQYFNMCKKCTRCWKSVMIIFMMVFFKVPGLNTRNRIITELRSMFRYQVNTINNLNHEIDIAIKMTRKSIEEHRESRDPNHPRDYIDCYLAQVCWL